MNSFEKWMNKIQGNENPNIQKSILDGIRDKFYNMKFSDKTIESLMSLVERDYKKYRNNLTYIYKYVFNKPVYVLSENELSIVRNYFYKCMPHITPCCLVKKTGFVKDLFIRRINWKKKLNTITILQKSLRC